MKTPNKWLVLLAVAIPGFMIEMAGTSVFVAFETIASDFSVSIDKSVWLTTLYLSANAMMIPLAGWLGKKLGHKRVITFGILLFALSALLGAVATNFEALVIFRAMQGLGDGPIMPVATALLLNVFPAKDRGKMMAGMMLAYGIAPAVGPLTASWLVNAIGWRSIFYMNALLGAISFLAVWIILPSKKPDNGSVKINWYLFMLLAIGTLSLQLFLDRGESFNWFDSPLIIMLLITSIVALLIYLLATVLVKDKTILQLKLLSDQSFLAGNLANIIVMSSLYGVMLLKIFYLQWLMGFTVVQSGIYQATLAGSMLVFSIFAGILTDKINPRWLVVAGLAVCLAALAMTTSLSLYSTMRDILIVGIVLGAGLAILATPITVTVFASIGKADMDAASVINSYLFVISSGICLALVTIFLMHRIDVNKINLQSAITECNPAIVNAMVANPASALTEAYMHVTRQGTMFAFHDVWYVIALILLLVLLYIPFMKKAKEEDGQNV